MILYPYVHLNLSKMPQVGQHFRNLKGCIIVSLYLGLETHFVTPRSNSINQAFFRYKVFLYPRLISLSFLSLFLSLYLSPTLSHYLSLFFFSLSLSKSLTFSPLYTAYLYTITSLFMYRRFFLMRDIVNFFQLIINYLFEKIKI